MAPRAGLRLGDLPFTPVAMSEISDVAYDAQVLAEMSAWRERVLRPAGAFDKAARNVQDRINNLIPEKVHGVITGAMEQMTRALLTGADYTSPPPVEGATLRAREAQARDKIMAWRTTAAAEGGVAGAGGFLLAAADFPVLIGLKIKLLFDLAAIYGHSGDDLAERLYILRIFSLAFSSASRRPEAYGALADWDSARAMAAGGLESLDWRRFQQEYRDYIDLAKLAQMIPVIGAPVGAFVNYRLLDRLGETAMNAYRMRWFAEADA